MTNTLPEDIWIAIAQYLEPEELKALQLSCQSLLQLIGGSDKLWQPLLNRLHAIDETISVIPNQGESIREAFIKGFEIVKSGQQIEIDDLLTDDNEPNLSSYHIVPHDKSVTLATLEKTSAQLDNYNFDIITYFINHEIANNSRRLELPWIGISRLPVGLFLKPEYTSFWQTLTSLNVNDNYLQRLPAWIGKLSNLKRMYCSDNKLRVLPNSMEFLPELELLDYCGNEDLVVPQSIKQKVGIILIREFRESSKMNMHVLESLMQKLGLEDSLSVSIDMDSEIDELSDEKSEEEDDLSSSGFNVNCRRFSM